MVLVGKQAPDFTAKAVVGQDVVEVTLSDLQKDGKYTLLFFYPYDFTFVCPTELIAFSDRVAEFQERNCEVLSVSIDSVFTHLAWKNTPRSEGGVGNIAYPMVADVNKTIQRAYDVEHDDSAAFRGLFLIDANGIIRHVTVNDRPLGRSVDEALRVLDALQFSEKHGEVCPANWKPGDDGINTKDANSYFAKTYTN